MRNNLLVMGKIPPPIGGVTIHVKRLLDKLEVENEINFSFKTLNNKSFLLIPLYIFNYRMIHLHTSSPFLRFYFAFFSNFSASTSIITYHGDLDRYSSVLLTQLNRYSIKWCSIPIVLNKSSYLIANRLNKNTQQISSFISPNLAEEYLPLEYLTKIKKLKQNVRQLYCTNAYGLTYDKNGIEIYGILEIINLFRSDSDRGLILSDPSGAYKNELKKLAIELPTNVIILNGNHSFYKVISLCDVSIRNTSTDGDSISVKESLFLNKITLCTDVVSRPEGVITYKRGKLKDVIKTLSLEPFSASHSPLVEATNALFKIYTHK